MSRPHLVGHQVWRSFHQMCYNPELCGVDRRLFVLTLLLGFVLHISTNLFLIPLGLTAVLIYILRRLCKVDPQLLSVMRAAFRHPAAWYDPGLPPGRFGPYLAERPDHADVPPDPLAALAPPPAAAARPMSERILHVLGLVLPRLFRPGLH